MNLALNLIPAGADYWTSKLITVTATGTNESKTYPDRIAALWQIYARLQQGIIDLLPQVQQYLPDAGLRRVSSVARTTGVGKEWKSLDPQLFPPEQRLLLGTSATSWTQTLPWSAWS